jgi:hypothetical protein
MTFGFRSLKALYFVLQNIIGIFLIFIYFWVETSINPGWSDFPGNSGKSKNKSNNLWTIPFIEIIQRKSIKINSNLNFSYHSSIFQII